MRSMYASAGAASAVILLMWGLMRTPEPQMAPNVVAQQEEPDQKIDKAIVEEYQKEVDDQQNDGQAKSSAQTRIEERLAQPGEVDFNEIPLRDVLTFLGEQIGTPILIDEASFEEQGIPTDEPVTFYLTGAKNSTIIDLILDRASLGKVTYTIRDNFIYVQTVAKLRENVKVEIYNVRDLLEGVLSTVRYEREEVTEGGIVMTIPGPAPGLGRGAPAAGRGGRGAPLVGGPMAGRGAGPMAGRGAGRGAMPGMGMVGAMGGSRRRSSTTGELVEVAPVEALIRVIIAATDDTWAQNGAGKGAIEEFDGLLVIRQSEDQHRDIKKLLEMLRETKEGIAKERPQAFRPDINLEFDPRFAPRNSALPVDQPPQEQTEPIPATLD
ncbi:MAG: hypothetical protein WEB58_16370 [Planctomycetaceae bacterium]